MGCSTSSDAVPPEVSQQLASELVGPIFVDLRSHQDFHQVEQGHPNPLQQVGNEQSAAAATPNATVSDRIVADDDDRRYAVNVKRRRKQGGLSPAASRRSASKIATTDSRSDMGSATAQMLADVDGTKSFAASDAAMSPPKFRWMTRVSTQVGVAGNHTASETSTAAS